MKKLISTILIVLMLASLMTSCKKPETKAEGTFRIVTTIFPEYDWLREITKGAENVEVLMLLDSGVDLHSFQPTAQDILDVSTCDMFIHVGGESDVWVDGVLREATNKDMVVLNLLELMGDKAKEEEVVEGMEADHDHEHEEEDEHEHDEDEEEHDEEDHDHEEPELDEHVWLSLRNASLLCEKISEALIEADPANQSVYEANTKAYVEKLSALDGQYQEAADSASVKTVLFGDRFPFRYMTDDYGLTYYAAFVGCSAETEASFDTISFLAGKVDELGLKTVLTIEGKDHSIAETIIDNTASKDQQILEMDSMQATTEMDVTNGATYLAIMESNLEILKEALK